MRSRHPGTMGLKVSQKLGKDAYRIELRPTTSIHFVFHASRLRAVHGEPHISKEFPPQLTFELELIMQPEMLKGVRPGKEKDQRREVLIQWKDFPESEATWRTSTRCKCNFQNSTLRARFKFGRQVLISPWTTLSTAGGRRSPFQPN